MVTTTATSADGTRIAYTRQGSGPALVLIDGALCSRAFGPHPSLATVLATDFTVYTYDRRGRGESTDTSPYAVRREVEDLAAVIAEAGGEAFVSGHSSGALLALHAGDLPIPKLVLFEPPIGDEDYKSVESEFTAGLRELVESGQRGEAVRRFQQAIGIPEEIIEQMRPVWPALEAMAHTIVYDCTIVEQTAYDLVRTVKTETLVLNSDVTGENLTHWAETVAEHLPNGTHRQLTGGWHGVPDEDLKPVLVEFLKG
jgi:pimeloyl-ACP methyl ester carboxylesterase